MANGPYYAPGAYAGKITEQGLGQSDSDNKTPYIYLKFQVIGIAKGTDQMVPFGEDVKQYERTAKRYVTEKTIDMVTEDLEQIGFTGTSFLNLQPGTPNHQSFVGDVFPFYCKHEKGDDGNTYERWQLSRPLGGGVEVKPLDASAARQLDALFGSRIKQISRNARQSARPAAVPAMATAGAPSADDVF